ncbi:MAG: hypothetical protein HY744_12115 [Deltaproteobacteria bacterium]|nr:hypothetical protein [Deltaproteobacteria bacterium]
MPSRSKHGMAKIELGIRNLESGESGVASFDSEQDAAAWLRGRPRFTEVLGPAGRETAPQLSERLRGCMRPLDPEECELARRREAERDAAMAQRAEAMRQAELDAARRQRDEAAQADPQRPMEVRWLYDRGMSVADPNDARAITEEARAAVQAWVDERQEWVRERNQVVGDARVTVWPGPLPESARGRRVVSGTFVPVAAPAHEA